MKRIFSFLVAIIATVAFKISVKLYKVFPYYNLGREAFYGACHLTKILRNVMLAELLYNISLDNTPEEKEAMALCMSFW